MSLDHAADLVKQQTPTRDAFLGGRLFVSQPERGFRAGLDSVLLGASVGTGTKRLLDLGAGVGTASLVALADRPEATATLVEIDPEMAVLAALNLSANGFVDRARVLTLDVTAKGSLRSAAGLPADHFDVVIANPPFFDPAAGSAPSAARSTARHMPPEALEAWVKAAATHAAPDGEVIFIHAAQSLPLLLSAFTARFGAVTVLPLTPRDGESASRVLVRGMKGSRAPFTLLASRALHESNIEPDREGDTREPHSEPVEGRGGNQSGRSRFRPEFDAIFRGSARLIW